MVGEVATRLVDQGVLLESARGPVPNVAELVAGEPIRGSWWAHPQGHRIFATINALAESPDVARIRLINRRITLVHRRLWASLLRLEARLPSGALLVVVEEHTPSGAHRVTNVPLASWVENDVRQQAAELDERAALAALPDVLRDHLSWVSDDRDADPSGGSRPDDRSAARPRPRVADGYSSQSATDAQ